MRHTIVAVALFAATAFAAPHLRVLTVNVWSGLDYHGTALFGEYETPERRNERFLALLHGIRGAQPDVIYLQEANPVGAFARRLADSLGYDEIHHVCNTGIRVGPVGLPWNLKEGIAILARPALRLTPLTVWKLDGSFGLYGDISALHFDESEFALVGRITLAGARITLVNAHLSADPPPDSALAAEFRALAASGVISAATLRDGLETWDDRRGRRANEIEGLCDGLEDLPPSAPVIVGGDLNAPLDEATLAPLTERAHLTTEHGRGVTWDPLHNENIAYSLRTTNANGDTIDGYSRLETLYDRRGRSIDHIFLGAPWQASDIATRIVLDSAVNGVHASDHYGVLATIDLAPVATADSQCIDCIPAEVPHTLEVLPILSYDTDAGVGYGVKAFLLNPFSRKESFDLTAFSSSKGERWYRMAFSYPDFEVRQGHIYPYAFDVVIDYDKWISNSFFGTGGDSKFSDREYYTREPIDIVASATRAWTPSLLTTIGTRWKSIRNMNFSAVSSLASRSALDAGTATSNTLFGTARYDSRDSYINPARGFIAQIEYEHWIPLLAPNVHLERTAAEIDAYMLLWYPRTVLAVRLRGEGVDGSTTGGDALPVQYLSSIGGNRTLRGSPQDRFLDNYSAILNAELRFPIWRRFGAVAGLDAGRVWHTTHEIGVARWATNPIFGLRYYFDTFVVRLDVGLGHETTGFYLNFGQLF